MQALIVHDDPAEVARIRAVLERRGFLTATCPDQDEAVARIRRLPVDLIVLKQVIGTRHTTAVALAGELRNPGLATILLSARSREDTLELFELVPSLFAILGPRPDGALLSSLALQAVEASLAPVLVLSPEARIRDPHRVPPLLASGFASRRTHAA